MPVLPRAASAGQKGWPLLMVLMPLEQFRKSTACIPSTLIRRTRLMLPFRKLLLVWAMAVPIKQAAARESKASVLFIVTSDNNVPTPFRRSVTESLIFHLSKNCHLVALPASQNLFLELEFRGDLDQTWSGRAYDLSEMGIIIHFTVHRCGPVELCVIEYVKPLNPELERFRLGYSQPFGQRHVKVVDSGTMEKSSGHVSQLPIRFGGESGRRIIERKPSVPRICVDIERCPVVFGRIQKIIVDAVPQRSQQRIIRVIVQSDRKTSAEAGGACDAPIIRQATGSLRKKIKGQGYPVACHKVVPHIPSGNRSRRRVVQWIELFAQVRTLIDGFSIGVPKQEIGSVSIAAQIRLQRVVTRILNCFLPCILLVV